MIRRRGTALAAALLTSALASTSHPARAQVPTGKILVLDLLGGSMEPTLRQTLTGVLTSEVRNLAPAAEVVSSEDVRTLLGVEAQKQLLGCDEDSCLTEIAGSLGADRIVAGSVGQVGDAYALTLRLLDPGRAGLVRSVTRETTEGKTALLDLVRSAAVDLLDPGRVKVPTRRSWSVGFSVGAVSDALRLGDGVGLDAELAFRIRANAPAHLEVAVGVALPGSYPLSLRYLARFAPLELGLVLRATPFSPTASSLGGQLQWALGAGGSVGASFRTPAGLVGVRAELLYSQALGLGATLPLSLALVWRL